MLTHHNEAWVLELLPTLCTAALAGGTPGFYEAVPIALQALAAPAATAFETRLAHAVKAAAALKPFDDGEGDPWGAHRRRLGAYAEALAQVIGDGTRARTLVVDALGLPMGYAGFNAPACLTLAESACLADCPPDVIERALASAQEAAHNVQDPTFCARLTSRCQVFRRCWWRDDGLKLGAFDVMPVVERFVAAPTAAEFAALHLVGWDYSGRNEQRGKQPLPSWVRQARSLRQLAIVYQQPLSNFSEVNPEITNPDCALGDQVEVRVPDPDLAPLLAARFAAELVVSTEGSEMSRRRLQQRLVPIAAANETALGTILARLLLLARPVDRAAVSAAYEKYRAIAAGN